MAHKEKGSRTRNIKCIIVILGGSLIQNELPIPRLFKATQSRRNRTHFNFL